MTAETGTAAATARTWTPRIAAQLAVLAAAAFIYVTAEILPVGALSAISRDLHVSVVYVGTLLTWYALVAALTTVPLVRWTAHWPRRRALMLSLTCLTVSQVISALAPNFAVLAAGRVLCAVTHGLLWAVIAPIATRLVPASHAGRATTSIYVGTSLALVIGSPLTAALSLMWGWRLAVVCVTAAAVVVTVAARAMLPEMVLTEGQLACVGPRSRHHRNGRLITVSLLAMVAVTGHFVSYTYHLGHHPRRRRRARAQPGLVVGRLRPGRPAVGVTGGAAAGPPPPGRRHPVHGGIDRRVRGADRAGVRRPHHHRGDRLDRDGGDRAVGRHGHRGVADDAIRRDAQRRRRPRRGVRSVRDGVSGGHHGRLTFRWVAVRAQRGDDADRVGGF